MQPDVAAKLAAYQAKVDRAIKDYFDSAMSRFDLDLCGPEKEAYAALREFSLRPGKRLRGSLVLFAYDCFSKKKNPSVAYAALALELVQNYLIIVDDVMDRSESRRGQPAMHLKFADRLKVKNLKDRHLANMMAINVALLAAHMAGAALCEVNEQPENIRMATKLLHRNVAMTGYGQIDDLYNTFVEQADEQMIIRLHELKDYYSFINPLQLGAALAGSYQPQLLNHLEEIGRPAGVAFQLQDDILGLFGDEKSTGKSASDDLREGKFTLLMRYTIDRARPDQVKKLYGALGNPHLTDEMHKEVKQIVIESGALDKVETQAKSYSEQAKKQVNSSHYFDEDSKIFLNGLLDYVIGRQA